MATSLREGAAAAVLIQSLVRGHQSRSASKAFNEFGFASSTAWFVLDGNSPVRKLAQRTVRSIAFRRFILCAILLNCALLAAVDYRPVCLSREYTLLVIHDCWRNQLYSSMEPVFLGIFLLELLLKVTAMGWFDAPKIAAIARMGWSRAWATSKKTGYLNSGWNWLDFTVVSSSLADLIFAQASNNITFLRIVRALRPLRALQSIPSMRFLIAMLLNSVLSVSYTLVFLMFIFLVWSIMAVQMWGW